MKYYAIDNKTDEILAVSNSLSMVSVLAQQQRPSLPGSAADYYIINEVFYNRVIDCKNSTTDNFYAFMRKTFKDKLPIKAASC